MTCPRAHRLLPVAPAAVALAVTHRAPPPRHPPPVPAAPGAGTRASPAPDHTRAAGDLVCCACAGNTAQRHGHGPFRPDALGYHQWAAGERDNGLTPWGEQERVSVELCWPAGSAYTVHVHDAVTGAEIGRAP